MANEDLRAGLKAVAERVARGYGLDIFDVQTRREASGWVVRVILDRPDPGQPAASDAPEETIGIEDCQRVSQDLSAILDVEEESLGLGLPEGYILEVSSPGLDRPLRDAADFRRFTGRLAKIVVAEPVGGQMHFEGRIKGLEGGPGDESVLVEQGRRTHRIPLRSVRRARLEVEF
jgi:ribosome maturation factor RimP